MEITSVTSKGQVTIPISMRQKLGIRQGSKLEFSIADDHIELRVKSSLAESPVDGFGLLKTKKTAVPVDFDAASLLQP